MYDQRFLAKKTSMFSLSGLRDRRFFEAMCPEVLKSLSEAELDAQMHKYFLANLAKIGKPDACIFHQSRGFDLESGFCALGKAVYRSISSLTK